jgi:hypothetical protein
MMDETGNKVREENKRPDMKTLIFADSVLIWGKYIKEIKENVNQLILARFEVLTMVILRVQAFLNVMLCHCVCGS